MRRFDRTEMEEIWLGYVDGYALFEAKIDSSRIATRWGRNGVSFLPFELERSGVPADSLDSLGGKELRKGVRVDLEDGRVVRKISGEVVSFYENYDEVEREVSYAEKGGLWVLRGIKILALSGDGVPLWGRAMSRPREATTFSVEESYFHEYGRVTNIHRELTQIDRGRELRSSIDFDLQYGAGGALVEINGVSRRSPSMKDVRERVFPKSN